MKHVSAQHYSLHDCDAQATYMSDLQRATKLQERLHVASIYLHEKEVEHHKMAVRPGSQMSAALHTRNVKFLSELITKLILLRKQIETAKHTLQSQVRVHAWCRVH